MSSATVQVCPDLLKAPKILSETTVRRSAVEQKDLKTLLEFRKKPCFSSLSVILLFTSFLKT